MATAVVPASPSTGEKSRLDAGNGDALAALWAAVERERLAADGRRKPRMRRLVRCGQREAERGGGVEPVPELAGELPDVVPGAPVPLG